MRNGLRQFFLDRMSLFTELSATVAVAANSDKEIYSLINKTRETVIPPPTASDASDAQYSGTSRTSAIFL